MKKLISALMAGILAVSMTASVYAEDIKMTVDGENVIFTDAAPFISEGRTLVPMRAMAEALGAEVEWDGEERAITLAMKHDSIYSANTEEYYTNAVTMVQFVVDEVAMSLGFMYAEDGSQEYDNSFIEALEIDVAPIIVNDRTYIPARYVGYALGYEVGWDDATKTVICKYTGVQDSGFGMDDEDKPEVMIFTQDGISFNEALSYFNLSIAKDGEELFTEAAWEEINAYKNEGKPYSAEFAEVSTTLVVSSVMMNVKHSVDGALSLKGEDITGMSVDEALEYIKNEVATFTDGADFVDYVRMVTIEDYELYKKYINEEAAEMLIWILTAEF